MVNNPQELLEELDDVTDDSYPVFESDSPELKEAAVGSIKVFDTAHGQVVMRKQSDSKWVPKDSPHDNLTSIGEDGILSNMATKKSSSLLPDADKLFDHGMNVLMIGLHGTGKTATIQEMVERRGLKMKYFSCSTLDPFTDLVGVPIPRDRVDADGKPTGEQYLEMVRPHSVDEADIIFFDELNRADAKTLNAVFEIIQFRSINGDPLPNLKACWGAINPPDEDYDVERLDAALLDRFDLFVNIDAKPSTTYMSQFIEPAYAQVLKRWWDDHSIDIRRGVKNSKTDYISPRRLLKLGIVWQNFENMKLLKAALPQGGNFDHMKLVKELRSASESIRKGVKVNIVEEEDETVEEYGDYELGAKPFEGFKYDAQWMRANNAMVAEFLIKHPKHYETHQAVAKVLQNGVGGDGLVLKYHTILDALQPSVLEGMFQAFPEPKKSMMRKGMKQLKQDNSAEADKLKNLITVLGGPSMIK